MTKEKISYSADERKKLLDYWNLHKATPPSLGSLVSYLSDGEQSDPRQSPWGIKTRLILKDAKIQAPSKAHQKVDKIELTDEQKQFIGNNFKDNSTYEMAKVLFPRLPGEGRLEPLGREVKAINIYLKEIGETSYRKEEGTVPEGRYEAPDKFHTVLAKINTYLYAELTLQGMTAYEKKCVETTKQFLHAPRFLQEINNYTTVEKRISFESEFIRAVYNKPDLSPEEVSLTINWCSDIIQAADLKKQLGKLNDVLDNVEEDRDGKISMSLVEAIGKVTTNLNEVLKRQERIYGLLNNARSKRTEDKQNKQANLAQLYEWFRDEENRKKMLRQVELQKEARKSEVKRMESLDDTIMLSLGLTSSEALL